MPYNYSHAIMGLKALQNCEKAGGFDRPVDEPMFLLGTMGADPYFGDALPPPVGRRARTDLADLLHASDGARLFCALLPLCRANDALFSYALGYLCHFLLDHGTHPYISTRFPDKLHTPAEIAIDALLISRSGDPRFFAPPKTFYPPVDAGMLNALDALHARLCWKLFALRTDGLYRRSLQKWLRINRLQFDPSGKKRALLRAFPRITQYLVTPGAPADGDPLNLAHASWGARGRTESFPDLLDAAVAEAERCIELAVSFRADGNDAPLAGRLRGKTADAAENL